MAHRRVVLDSGALSALAKDQQQIRGALEKALSAGARMVVPTAVIAESTTGDFRRDAATNHIIFTTDPLDIRRLASVMRRTSVDAF